MSNACRRLVPLQERQRYSDVCWRVFECRQWVNERDGLQLFYASVLGVCVCILWAQCDTHESNAANVVLKSLKMAPDFCLYRVTGFGRTGNRTACCVCIHNLNSSYNNFWRCFHVLVQCWFYSVVLRVIFVSFLFLFFFFNVTWIHLWGACILCIYFSFLFWEIDLLKYF